MYLNFCILIHWLLYDTSPHDKISPNTLIQFFKLKSRTHSLTKPIDTITRYLTISNINLVKLNSLGNYLSRKILPESKYKREQSQMAIRFSIEMKIDSKNWMRVWKVSFDFQLKIEMKIEKIVNFDFFLNIEFCNFIPKK